MTKDERHFIRMCAESGLISGARFNGDKSQAKKEAVIAKYRDETYMEGYRKLVEERLWKTKP